MFDKAWKLWRKDSGLYMDASLKYRFAHCDSLIEILAYFISNVKINNCGGMYFCTVVILEKHVFGLISSTGYLELGERRKFSNFKEFCRIFPDRDAVICDPWIWKTSCVDSRETHIKHADMFDAAEFFEGEVEIEFFRNFAYLDKDLNTSIITFKDSFFENYRKELNRLNHLSFVNSDHGRRFSSVMNSLIDNHIPVQRSDMERMIAAKKELVSFIEYIISRLSSFYSTNWFNLNKRKDRKREALNRILELCKDKNFIIYEDIITILKSTVTICLIPRGETADINKVNSIAILKETASGSAALDAFKGNAYLLLKSIVSEANYTFNSYPDLLFFSGITNFRDLYLNKPAHYSFVNNIEMLIDNSFSTLYVSGNEFLSFCHKNYIYMFLYALLIAFQFY